MLLAVVSVGGRNFLNQPLPGYVDWIEQAMPLIAFMGISFTQRLGGHIRMDIVVGQLKGRALWAAEFVTTSLVLVLMLLLIWGSWAHFEPQLRFHRAALVARQLVRHQPAALAGQAGGAGGLRGPGAAAGDPALGLWPRAGAGT